jgi:hypothetical protein
MFRNTSSALAETGDEPFSNSRYGALFRTGEKLRHAVRIVSGREFPGSIAGHGLEAVEANG